MRVNSFILLMLFVFFTSCQKREWNNPFDPECPKELWTPTDFVSIQQGNAINLSWMQAVKNITGFRLERKIEGETAWKEVVSPEKTTNSWTNQSITGGKLYEYRIVAIAGGNESNFATVDIKPLLAATLTTAVPSAITATSVLLGGTITTDGGAAVTERGICWATTIGPTTGNNKLAISSEMGTFSNTVIGLTANTSYYVRAYATNSQGTAYGAEIKFTTTQVLSLATVTTSVASSLTSSSAVLGGSITSDGNATVTERGVCYSTIANPTTSSTKVVIGNGIGSYSNSIPMLDANTTYYVRAYAINSLGTAYGNEVNFKTSVLLSLATLTTNAATNITSASATLGGNVTSDGNATVTERGICYGTIQTPTTGSTKLVIGAGTGAFSNSITGLTANTTYYVRAYAINSQGTAYGIEVNFKTSVLLSLATLATNAATNITSTSATLGGNVTSDGNATVTERGICYSTIQTPTTGSTKLVIGTGTGAFSNSITGLTANTTYYVRAYAINSQGTAYGIEVNFKTSVLLSLATLATNAATNITSTSATLGGNVTSDGNATVTERGICYSTIQTPTTGSTKLVIGTGTGSFSNSITGLTANTTYYVRAYAINSQGTAYGNEQNFKTSLTLSLASLTTNTPTNLTSTGATLGGNVTSDGNATVTERGICYSTIQTPTTGSTKLVIGAGTGAFSNSITGLTANTTYYVRAYAINSQGTAYGNEQNFKTSLVLSLATLTTNTPSSITASSATLGGNISSDGNVTVTERGICYSTSTNPSTSNTKVANGSGTGSFSQSVTGLTANTTFYVRAYAINSQGTAYGSQENFTTDAEPNTVTDIDGNVYHTVTIGTQVWMVENLKTTKYNDGTPISNVTNSLSWVDLTTGAYCWYNNDLGYKNSYGAFYNWYAVNGDKLAPQGWHVPTDAEWTALINYVSLNLSNSTSIASALVSNTDWNSSPSYGAPGFDLLKNNSTGFTALPRGYRSSGGAFWNDIDYGFWWSLSQFSTNEAWYRFIFFNDSDVKRGYQGKNYGLSVRCIKD